MMVRLAAWGFDWEFDCIVKNGTPKQRGVPEICVRSGNHRFASSAASSSQVTSFSTISTII